MDTSKLDPQPLYPKIFDCQITDDPCNFCPSAAICQNHIMRCCIYIEEYWYINFEDSHRNDLDDFYLEEYGITFWKYIHKEKE